LNMNYCRSNMFAQIATSVCPLLDLKPLCISEAGN
jgi:hypothetical protein